MKDTMILRKDFREAIEKQFGEEIRYQYQCMALEDSIFSSTGDHLGLSTLKRIFGFVAYTSLPARSTMDILARYIGYSDYRHFEQENQPFAVTSGFETLKTVESVDLSPGQKIKLKFQPGRVMKLEYIGDERYRIEDINGGRLQKGDILKIRQIAQDFELLVNDVEREGKSLGSYVGARMGGVQKIYRN